jgi:hypothetical protein
MSHKGFFGSSEVMDFNDDQFKPKLAHRARKRKEKMGACKMYNEMHERQEPVAGPVTQSDSDHSIVDVQKEDGDERIYERAPSPVPNPFSINELYLACIRCSSAGMIEYPSGYNLGVKLEKSITCKISLASTVCRTCCNKYSDDQDGDKLIAMMWSIKISPFHFSFGPLGESLPVATDVLRDGDGIAYIPLKLISNSLNESCTLKSMINNRDKYVTRHLRGGFF